LTIPAIFVYLPDRQQAPLRQRRRTGGRHAAGPGADIAHKAVRSERHGRLDLDRHDLLGRGLADPARGLHQL